MVAHPDYGLCNSYYQICLLIQNVLCDCIVFGEYNALMIQENCQIEKEFITHFIGFETLVSSASVGEWLRGMFHGKSS